MRTSEVSGAVCAAYVAAAGEIEPAKKDSTNPHFRTNYADLMAYIAAAREPLKRHKLAVGQEVVAWDNGIAVVTRVTHSSGEWIEFGPTPIPVTKHDAQAVGSAITYGRRYAYAAALGMGADDDDASSASAKPTAPLPASVARPPRYDEWVMDLEAAADAGTLAAAFKESAQPLRDYLTQHDKARAAALKTRAAKTAAA